MFTFTSTNCSIFLFLLVRYARFYNALHTNHMHTHTRAHTYKSSHEPVSARNCHGSDVPSICHFIEIIKSFIF